MARTEVDRAVKEATRQLTDTRDRYLPRLDDYRRRIRRWSRVAIIVVVLFVALSAWTSATLQVGLLEWIGDRIDAATASIDATPVVTLAADVLRGQG